ncbi:MAG: 6-hydroxymethylpterin diphosphokinase MptE-like protein [Thermoplasmata archaeon]
MEYAEWAPYYEKIQQQFGFSFPREEAAAARLVELLPEAARSPPLTRIGPRLRGHDVVVVGLAPRAGPPPLWRLASSRVPLAVLAADGAARPCLEAGIVPTAIVTDLDGPVASEVSANARGALTIVHAHGDNIPALEEWVPHFAGELAGSWAGAPTSSLLDVGGFTDGDRAAFLAAHLGARRVLLWGFDFKNVEEIDAVTADLKRAKLEWARQLLGVLAERSTSPVLTWEIDGTLHPYVGGK